MLHVEHFKDHPVGGAARVRGHVMAFTDMLVNKKTRQPTLYGWIFIIMLVLILLTIYRRTGAPSGVSFRPGGGRFMSPSADAGDDVMKNVKDPQEEEFKAARERSLRDGKGLIVPDFDPNKHKDMHEHDPVKARHMKHHGKPSPKEFPVDLIHQPRLHCPENKILLLILVSSRPDGTGERSAIRRTWGVHDAERFPSLGGAEWRTIFVMGMSGTRFDQEAEKENEQYGDILQGNFKDTPFEKTRKVMLGMKWVGEHIDCAPQFVLKTDDNIYHNMPAIIEWLHARFKDKTNIFVGKLLRRDRPVRNSEDPYYVPYADYQDEIFPDLIQSPEYLFSADVFVRLNAARRSVKPIAMEDGYLGVLAKKAGIQPRHNDHFQMLIKPSNVCHHLKMFFIFNVLPYENIEILKSMKAAVKNKDCLDADMVDFENEQAHHKINL